MNRFKPGLRTLILTVILLCSFGELFGKEFSSKHPSSVTFQVFYDKLSPYGSWVSYSNYGYVWIPSIGSGFIPYSTSGHWVYTDYGWTWASGYSWGWAPFHYGRWLYDDFYGWMWVPGYEWAPAWVVWGSYDYYYGWAPIAPGITVIAGYRPPSHYWLFCPTSYMTHVHVHRYIVTSGIPRDQVTIIDNYNSQRGYYYGPRRESVEKATGKPVTRVSVVERNSPAPTKVSGNKLEVYRPSITKGNATPSQVKKLEQVKPVNKSFENEDPVYDRGDKQQKITPAERENKSIQDRKPGPTESEKKEKIIPQHKTNPPVQDRKYNPAYDKEEKITPQPKTNPPVQERKYNPPQDRGKMNKQEKIAPQQKVNPPVQDRTIPQNQPPQKKQKVSPR